MKAPTLARRNLLALFLCVLAANAVSQSAHQLTSEELQRDLRSAIILAGYPCNTVVAFTNPAPTDYHVTCDADRLYRVHVSEENEIVVESRSDPHVAASEVDADHDAFMRRQLFAIVNLAGHECGRVVHHEMRGTRESIVTCEDRTTYRIHVTPEGRVEVDRHPAAK